jgi:hypothetical protein
MLATILLAAVAAGPIFPAAGTYRYNATLHQQRIGEWTASVKAGSGTTEVDESSTASLGGMQLAATASLVLGADLAPQSYQGSYRMGSQNPTVSVTLTSTSASVSGTMIASTQRLSLQPGTQHFVVIDPGLLAGLFALPAQLAAWKENTVTWITPSTAQAQTLSVSPAAAIARPTDVPANDALLSIVQPMAVTIWYDPTTLVPDEVIVPSQQAVLTRERS